MRITPVNAFAGLHDVHEIAHAAAVARLLFELSSSVTRCMSRLFLAKDNEARIGRNASAVEHKEGSPGGNGLL